MSYYYYIFNFNNICAIISNLGINEIISYYKIDKRYFKIKKYGNIIYIS